MKSVSSFAALLLIAMGACTNSTSVNRQLVFDKLVGTWQAQTGFEQWTKNKDGSFRSVAFSVNGRDTSWNEMARIYQENDKWVFEATAKDQNDGKATKFTSCLLTDSRVQFSNPVHDFPTDINYSVVDMNTVHGFIAGPNNKGGKDTISFDYTRVK